MDLIISPQLLAPPLRIRLEFTGSEQLGVSRVIELNDQENLSVFLDLKRLARSFPFAIHQSSGLVDQLGNEVFFGDVFYEDTQFWVVVYDLEHSFAVTVRVLLPDGSLGMSRSPSAVKHNRIIGDYSLPRKTLLSRAAEAHHA